MSCWYEAEGYSCAETDASNVNKKKACPIGQAFLHVIITGYFTATQAAGHA